MRASVAGALPAWTIPRIWRLYPFMAESDKTERTIAPIGGGKSVAEEVREPEAVEASTEETDEPMGSEDFERLLDMYDVSFRNFAEGEVVKGVVLQVSESEVIVDVGYKSEGIIALEEFRDETGKVNIKVGDIVDVLLEIVILPARRGGARRRGESAFDPASVQIEWKRG